MFRNADKKRFGKLIEDTDNEFSKGVDNYPKSIGDAYNLLNNYKQYTPKKESSAKENLSFYSNNNNNKKPNNKDASNNASNNTSNSDYKSDFNTKE